MAIYLLIYDSRVVFQGSREECLNYFKTSLLPVVARLYRVLDYEEVCQGKNKVYQKTLK